MLNFQGVCFAVHLFCRIILIIAERRLKCDSETHAQAPGTSAAFEGGDHLSIASDR